MSMLGSLGSALGLANNTNSSHTGMLAGNGPVHPGGIGQYQMLQQNQLMQQYAHAQAAAQKRRDETPTNPNKSEAYQAPLSTVINMWRAKYGDEWVVEYATMYGEEPPGQFYVDAFRRLRDNELFEVYNNAWFRLKEGV